MLSQAASRLGFDVVILDPQPDCPAARVSRAQITAPYDDPDALQALGRLCDVVTFEFENVPAASVETLAEAGALVAPGPTALAVGQDRVDEKTYLNAVDAPTVAFAAVTTLDDLTNAIERLGLPALLKTRREGYDGKGQVWIRDAAEAEAAFDAIGRRPAVLEAAAVFQRELSIIAARGHDGAVAVYPLGENVHKNGVLKTTIAPAAVDPATQARAEQIAAAVLDGLDYIGVMGIELFDMGDGELLVNEVAPRPQHRPLDPGRLRLRPVRAARPRRRRLAPGPHAGPRPHRDDQSAGRRGRGLARPGRPARRPPAPLRQARRPAGTQDGARQPHPLTLSPPSLSQWERA